MIPILDLGKNAVAPAKLASVYKDACSHISVAKMIQQHLSSDYDIRQVALESLDLSGSKNILDAGCGFGYFTAGLQGVVPNRAQVLGIDIHPENKVHFLRACKKANFRGKFISSGINYIHDLPNESYDLIISSFSMYFFPEAIEQFARLLKKEGTYVIITHALPHMHELTTFVKALLQSEGINWDGDLPYESLIRKFSSENGEQLLTPWFSDIQQSYCKSSLVFPDGDYNSLLDYFRFKHRFFLPEIKQHKDEFIQLLLEEVKGEMKRLGAFEITKDDAVFVCRNPIFNKHTK